MPGRALPARFQLATRGQHPTRITRNARTVAPQPVSVPPRMVVTTCTKECVGCHNHTFHPATTRPVMGEMCHFRALTCPPRKRLSEFSRSVNVGTVFDSQNSDQVALVVDAVDHAVVASPGAVQTGEAELELLADPVGIGSQGTVKKFHRWRRDLLWESAQRAAGRGPPRDREVALAHRSAIRRSASSLLSTCASLSASASRMSSRRAALSMTSSVSSRDSRSSTLMTTAAG